MAVDGWFLSAEERGNPATALDRRHPDGRAWSEGNHVVPLVHGSSYFAELHRRLGGMDRGDLLMFVDWRGDPDEQLLGQPGSEIARVLCAAARRGVDVRGLVWRSHLDRLQFSAAENRHLGEDINAAGGEVVLDMRVRPGGSHHQKFMVLRHPGRPERDVVFLGGIDLCHSRRDDAGHRGDPQPVLMPRAYGDRPPWHDVQLMVTGPAVGDVETVFRERWQDPQRLSRSPLRRLGDRVRHDQPQVRPLPPQLPDPEPTGDHPLQLLRTYPNRWPGYDFAPRGERSVARGYAKVVARARRLIYLEDQYLWSPQVASVFARALQDNPDLRLVAVLPHHPDQDGRFTLPPNLVGRAQAVTMLRRAAGDRVAFYGIENEQGVPVYVHAKVCVVDDLWASVGSDNLNRRSWTHDSELSAAVCDPGYARSLRTRLNREHLGEPVAEEALDPDELFGTFARSAARLQCWHDGGSPGPRPAGRLRPLEQPSLPRFTRAWATPLYRTVYDPDGRPLALRAAGRF